MCSSYLGLICENGKVCLDGSVVYGSDAVNVNDNDSRIWSAGGSSNGGSGAFSQQPKGVPLQFIDGEWVENQSLKPYAWP